MRVLLSIVSVVAVTLALPQLNRQVPGVPSVQVINEDQCCCIPVNLDCFDTVGQGRIDPKQPQQLEETCLSGYKTCCYAQDLDISVFWCSKNFYNFYYN